MNPSIYPSHPSIYPSHPSIYPSIYPCMNPSIHPSTPTAVDEMVFDRSTNLSGIPKLFLLKFSVTLIVAQGLIANILVTTHTGEQLLLMMLIDDA